MGEYWKPVNLTRREFVHPHHVGCGLKLGEWWAPERPLEGSRVQRLILARWALTDDVRAVSDYGGQLRLWGAGDAPWPEYSQLEHEFTEVVEALNGQPASGAATGNQVASGQLLGLADVDPGGRGTAEGRGAPDPPRRDAPVERTSGDAPTPATARDQAEERAGWFHRGWLAGYAVAEDAVKKLEQHQARLIGQLAAAEQHVSVLETQRATVTLRIRRCGWCGEPMTACRPSSPGNTTFLMPSLVGQHYGVYVHAACLERIENLERNDKSAWRLFGLLERCLLAARDALTLTRHNPCTALAADEIAQRVDAIAVEAGEPR